jgi:OmcA/MtrC family decaheme c-type cytochrome
VTPGLPVQINALEEATDNGDGTFSVTSPTAIPDDISGSGVVAIEGHPAAVGNTAGTYDLRVPVANAVQSFAITDILPANRRTVVDIANCNQCHGNLSLHGNNRTGTTQVCVICHNGNATDINRRPDDPTTTTDGKTEETIDFKHLIHAIHGAGMREEGIVIYGYGNSEHDFDHVEYPGIVNKCNACHVSSTFTVPLNSYVWTTTINTGDDLVVPEDDRWITPAASVCSSCHDGTDDKLHMMQNGAAFDVGGPVLAEDGNAGIIQPPGHSTAPGCTSAFACHG